jgi:hypothetical protein
VRNAAIDQVRRNPPSTDEVSELIFDAKPSHAMWSPTTSSSSTSQRPFFPSRRMSERQLSSTSTAT